MDIAKLRQLYAEKINQAKALSAMAKDGVLAQEQVNQINALLGEADQIKVQIEMAGRVTAGDQWLNEPAGTKAAHLGWREAGPGEGDAPFDPQDWREMKVRDRWSGEEVTLRYYVPLAVQSKGYPAAFERYLRKGLDGMGPQDRKTLSEGIDTAGGFLAPADLQASILKKVATVAAIRARARKITTSRDMVKWPKVNYTADDKYTSGVRLTWTGEIPSSATVHRVTDPVFGEELIPVHTAMASMPLTNDLLEDNAFDVLGVASDLMGEAFGLGEDDVFINGSGAGRPEGILTHPNSSVIYTSPPGIYVKTSSASALTADGLIALEAQLPAQYEANAVWVMSKATKSAIRQLKATTNEYIFPPTNAGGPFIGRAPEELMGYPILKDEFMPAIGANTFPIILGDLSGYLIADRVGLSIQILRELYAETNISLVLARKRVGGQLVESYRLRTHKCEA